MKKYELTRNAKIYNNNTDYKVTSKDIGITTEELWNNANIG